MAAPSGFSCASAGLIEWPDWRVWVEYELGLRWLGFEGVWTRIFFDALQYALKVVPVHSWWPGQTMSSGLFVDEAVMLSGMGF